MIEETAERRVMSIRDIQVRGYYQQNYDFQNSMRNKENLIGNQNNLESLSKAASIFSSKGMNLNPQETELDTEMDIYSIWNKSIYRGVGDGQVSSIITERTEGIREDAVEFALAEEEDSFIGYVTMFRDKIEELFVKIQKGNMEPTYQIGSQSFTEKEWDGFLKKFDTIEEAMREAMREEHDEKSGKKNEITKRSSVVSKQALQSDEVENIEDTVIQSLTLEFTKCFYPSGNKKEEDILYITSYTEDGICCRKQGQTEGYLWSIEYTDENQYNMVMEFLNRFDSDGNLRFASHENFWRDFLDGKIDEEEFVAFFDGTDNGVPNYSITIGDSMYIDKEKVKFAPYMNSHSSKMYTGEEMMALQEGMIRQATERLHRNQLSATEIYRQHHPDYNGERIFCEYPGGLLYNAEEILNKMFENLNFIIS